MSQEPRMIMSTSRRPVPAANGIPVWPTIATAAAMMMVGAMMFV